MNAIEEIKQAFQADDSGAVAAMLEGHPGSARPPEKTGGTPAVRSVLREHGVTY